MKAVGYDKLASDGLFPLSLLDMYRLDMANSLQNSYVNIKYFHYIWVCILINNLSVSILLSNI